LAKLAHRPAWQARPAPGFLAYLCPNSVEHLAGLARQIAPRGTGAFRRAGRYQTAVSAAVRLGETPWFDAAAAMLKDRKPETDEEVKSIVKAAEREHLAQTAEEAENDEREAMAILDGSPPDLPPIAPPASPLKLGAAGAWPEEDSFNDAFGVILGLCAKSPDKFAGHWSREELVKVAEFLSAVAAQTRAEAA
jgi:hypothetical protein